ncbi:SDR family NAD(P)-dependent oxidoreductase [Chitinophaga silvatica]|uniref:SDR family NAD(P)-dependent oxidoreductase n=1 Tax=Chitinophaga silvatica TaxID=2282649 RepID=A0A3E1YHJ8_9BACT|nr:SDR family NAD(P)-dependent oxidoreductase [Chitinophaga silvatica]RFS26827.1 SDR family NAD(P)-dependent oxidoreductase [Chitinophaga silvatica]
MDKRISVLSCGWLGFPLAIELQKNGFLVKGARTSVERVTELQQVGINAYQVLLSPEQIIAPAEFWESDIVVINLPPRIQRGKEAHIAEMQLLNKLLADSAVAQVIFISSTSVYAANEGIVTEEDTELPATPNGQALREVESTFLQNRKFATTVLRFGGLIGYNRLPDARRFGALPDTLAQPMNVIHRDDCIAIISALILNPQPGEIFNACAGEHPLRYTWYEKAAIKLGLTLPPLAPETPVKGKIIDSGKLLRQLSYSFKYNDPMQLF